MKTAGYAVPRVRMGGRCSKERKWPEGGRWKDLQHKKCSGVVEFSGENNTGQNRGTEEAGGETGGL